MPHVIMKGHRWKLPLYKETIMRGRISKIQKNAIQKMPLLPKSGNNKCTGIRTALHTILYFYILC